MDGGRAGFETAMLWCSARVRGSFPFRPNIPAGFDTRPDNALNLIRPLLDLLYSGAETRYGVIELMRDRVGMTQVSSKPAAVFSRERLAACRDSPIEYCKISFP